MEKQFSYRITKIGGKAVAVAFAALAIATSASAADILLGTSYSGGTPNDGTTGSSAYWYGGPDSWTSSTHTGSYGTNVSRAGDIFYGSSATSWCGSLSYLNSDTTCGFSRDWMDGDTGYWVDAQRSSTYLVNTFGNIVDLSSDGNNYVFGVGATVSDTARGSKAYTTVSTYDGGVWGTVTFSFLTGSAASQNVNGRAIDINGAATFDGDNQINGSVVAGGVYVRGSNVNFNGSVTAPIYFSSAGAANINGGGDVVGTVDFQGHNATLTLSNLSDITGSVVNSATDNGTLNFEGSSVVTGAVGTINAVNVTGATSRVQLNTVSGDTNVNTLTISADKAVVEVGGKLTGNVSMGGHTSKLELLNGPSANAGMSGVLDFGKTTANDGKGTLEIGNGVNVTFGAGGIELARAANATLLFAGDSVVTGNVGSAASASVTPYKIYAGAGTVNFGGLVTVGSGALNVGPSNSTVVLNQGLVGNLVFGSASDLVDLNGSLYSSYGDGGVAGTWGNGGTVKVGHEKTITGSITSYSSSTGGTLMFMGSSNYGTQPIGTSSNPLTKVVFNSETAGAVTNVIAGNVHAGLVEIGNGSTAVGSKTTATLTSGTEATPAVLGNALVLANARTTLNTDATFGTAGALPSDLAFVKNADGTLTGAPTQTAVGAGGITTNGATLNFSIDAGNVTTHNGAVVPATSSKLSTTGAVTVSGGVNVNAALMGSVSDGKVATLIDGASITSLGVTTLTHNSYVLGDGALSLRKNTGNGNLELVVDRAAEIYKTRSDTVGHFSNAAADQLGALAAAGADYTSDMQTVFNKLDIDQWGFGNTQANLATQVKRLAPIANASGALAALASTTSVLTSVGERLAVLRGDVAMAGLNGNGRLMGTENTGWVKVLGSNSKAKAIGDYDGFKVTNSGLVAGADAKVGNGVVGGSFSYLTSNITQQDFRLGDSAKMSSGTLAVYGTQEYGDVFVDGALAFSQHNLESNRATAIARIAQADVDMNQTTLKLSAGYRIGIDDSKVNVLTPMVSVEAASLKQKAYTETGADALSLNVDSKSVSRTRASLGLRFNTVIEGANTTFYPEFSVAFNRNSGMRNTDVVANYVGDTAATAFTTAGALLPKSSYTVGAGLRFATSKTSEVQVGYRFEGGNGLSGSSAQVRGAWSF